MLFKFLDNNIKFPGIRRQWKWGPLVLLWEKLDQIVPTALSNGLAIML